MSKGIDFVNPMPLYEQIVNDIKKRIAQGELRPGERIETHQELAKRYNVSLITVKNALTNLVNEGVLFSRAGKGTYVSEPQSRRIDRSEGKMVGVVLRDLKHPYFSLIVHSIEERAYELGFHLLLSSSSQNLEREENQIDRFRELGVEGLIIASLSLQYRATRHIQRVHDDNFPYVMVSYIHDPEYWYVGSDHELGAFLATQHLIVNGYNAIGYAHIGRGNLLSEVRKNGYARALAEHDMPFTSELVFFLEPEPIDAGADRFQLGFQFAKRFSTLKTKPDALFCYNDLVALGFLQGATEEGIKIPDDVALVGYDDAQVAQYASVPLTTIHQPVDKIGRLAVDIIQKRIEKRDASNRTILKPTLVIRESCGVRKRTLQDHSSPGSRTGPT